MIIIHLLCLLFCFPPFFFGAFLPSLYSSQFPFFHFCSSSCFKFFLTFLLTLLFVSFWSSKFLYKVFFLTPYCFIFVLQEFKARFDVPTKTKVLSQSSSISDPKLRNLVVEFGIGYHHVGFHYKKLCNLDQIRII